MKVVNQAAKKLTGPGRDLLGRTVCMYTAKADAYRTAGLGISTTNRK